MVYAVTIALRNAADIRGGKAVPSGHHLADGALDENLCGVALAFCRRRIAPGGGAVQARTGKRFGGYAGLQRLAVSVLIGADAAEPFGSGVKVGI